MIVSTAGIDEAIDALSTRCGGRRLVVLFDMAKPVRAPQVGPVRAHQNGRRPKIP